MKGDIKDKIILVLEDGGLDNEMQEFVDYISKNNKVTVIDRCYQEIPKVKKEVCKPLDIIIATTTFTYPQKILSLFGLTKHIKQKNKIQLWVMSWKPELIKKYMPEEIQNRFSFYNFNCIAYMDRINLGTKRFGLEKFK
jgi:hypothetical protein